MKQLILSIFIATILLAGCDQPKSGDARAASSSEPSSAKTVQMAECVVCGGHKHEVTPTTPRADYNGQTYYFCAEGCLEAFEKEPTKFVAAADVDAAKPSAGE